MRPQLIPKETIIHKSVVTDDPLSSVFPSTVGNAEPSLRWISMPSRRVARVHSGPQHQQPVQLANEAYCTPRVLHLTRLRPCPW